MTTGDIERQWREAAGWWIREGAADPVYEETIAPVLHRLLEDVPDEALVLDLGCGEGSVAAGMRQRVVGIDVTMELLSVAARVMPVVQARLPHLEWLKTGCVAAACAVLVLEHLADLDGFYAETARVVSAGGRLVVVSNHPAYTAPGAGPLIDMNDGEVLWRWGPYFSRAVSDEPAGDGTVRFHHRDLGSILTTAASAGWSLEQLVELPLSPATIAGDPGFAGQGDLPRLFAALWRRLDG